MASVTFSTTVGGDGSTVSDDTSTTTGLRNGGYLTRFVPALQQVVAVAGFVLAQATAASGSATAASASASAASMSAFNAASSASSAAAAYDAFDDRWLGAKSADPTVDNDGNPLLLGAVYWNTTASETRVWTGTIWQTATINGGTIANLNVTGNTTLGDAGTDTLTVNAAATFAGSLAYTGTLTGGDGVINIGSGQIYKDANGNVMLGGTSPGYILDAFSADKGIIQIRGGSASGQGGAFFVKNAANTLTFAAFGDRARIFGGTVDQSASIYTATGIPLLFDVAGSTKATMDTAGNLGLGVTPSAWGSQRALDFSYGGLSIGSSLGVQLVANAFYNGTNWIYRNSVTAQRYEQDSNGHKFFIAPSGTAGNPITFTQAAALFQTGNYVLGATVDGVSRHRVEVGTQTYIYEGLNAGTAVYRVLANGNVQNTNNSYGAISDAKLKNIIAPRDGAHYWEKFKLIKFWIYSLINDPTNQQLLGVVAQELRDIFPGLIIETPDMHEVTKTRTVTTTRQVTEPVEQQQVKTEVVLENGRYVQKTTVEIVTLDEPVFDEYPLYDENGDRVMTLVSPEVEEQLDEGGNVIVEAQLPLYEPATHKVPRTETVESVEEYTEMEPTGEVTLAVNYSILGLIADTITQELQRRMESAEQRLDLLEAA